jgi:FkbM family methyltransferase
VESCFAVFGTNNIAGMAIAAHCLRKNDTVFEFGANVGTETLAFAGLVGPKGKVIAVEADPENVLVLNDRVKQNKLSQVIIVPKAASDSNGVLELHRGSERGHSSVSAEKSGEQRASAVKVEGITADELFTLYGSPGLLFIDIEGAEYLALRGAGKLLQAARPVIFLEVISKWLRRCTSTAEQIYELLRENDYKVYDPNGWSLPEIKPELLKKEADGDWLALPAERVSVDHGAIRNALWRARLLPKMRYLSPLWY